MWLWIKTGRTYVNTKLFGERPKYSEVKLTVTTQKNTRMVQTLVQTFTYGNVLCLTRWWHVQAVVTRITNSTTHIPQVSIYSTFICSQYNCDSPLSSCSPHLVTTDNFKPQRRCFLMFSMSLITPMASIPAGVLCIQWRLATENVGRSNQPRFTSLDPFPQLGLMLPAVKCLLLNTGLLVKWMQLVVKG